MLAVGERPESSDRQRSYRGDGGDGDRGGLEQGLRAGLRTGLGMGLGMGLGIGLGMGLGTGLGMGLTSMATPTSCSVSCSSVSMGTGLAGAEGGLSGGSCPGSSAGVGASGLGAAPGSGLGAGDGSGLSLALDFLLEVERRRPAAFSLPSVFWAGLFSAASGLSSSSACARPRLRPFFRALEAGGGGGGDGAGAERPSLRGRPRERFSGAGLVEALANRALRPARVTGGGPLSRGSCD